VTSQLRRVLASVAVAVLSAALGAFGVILMSQGRSPRLPATASGERRLRVQAVYDEVEPAVVDVTSTLRYDAETAQGTGFVINAADGLVLTNNHVIRDATAVTITLTSDGRQFPARIVGVDVPADVALLQVQGTPRLSQASVGNSGGAGSGTPVLAIGNQAGAGGAPTVAPGVITGTGQTIEANDASTAFTETLRDMLATSAHIAPGDSGGPLADAGGQVVGMVTAAGASAIGAGYAIPINDALAAARLIAVGHPSPGVIIGMQAFLGVVTSPSAASSPQRQVAQGHSPKARSVLASGPGCLPTSAPPAQRSPARIAPTRSGALVYGVLCGTGAQAAGLAPGDVITDVAGHRVPSPAVLTVIVNSYQPGSLIAVTWITPAGQRQTSLVRLDAAPAA
jgi:S1-C subfamily serine protease